MNLFTMRLRGILKKEVLQILRDPSSIALALVMPLVLLFLFGYGVNLDAENIPVAVITEDDGGAARDLVGRFELSRQFQVCRVTDIREAESLMQRRDVEAIVRLRNDFSARLTGSTEQQAPVQLIINGIDGNRARLIEGYVKRITGTWAAQRRARGEAVSSGPVSIAHRIWFNEGAQSRNFLVPGLITLIMTLIGILLTALVIAREWERGTMEAMLVTPLRRFDILLGKILPYYVLGMLGMGLSVAVGVLLFEVPFRGSLTALAVLGSLFMLASLGFGLLLSAAVRVQFVAAQISIVAGFLPAFFLSGLIFDLESTPKVIQIISHAVPAKYFVNISHTLFMAGDIWSILLPNGLVLAGMAIVFLSLAFRKITKRLDG
jgi:ABC-2 type transport system permease protein